MIGTVPQAGRVVFVGAGPGDPDLMTVRSREVLARAEVVVVDRPERVEFAAAFAPCGARILHALSGDLDDADVATEPFARSARAKILLSAARDVRAGGVIVRLMDGDPGLFHGFADEALALRRAGIAFDVVPGVSAVTAVPTYAGVPLTSGAATAVHLVHAGHDRHTWEASVSDDVTVVILGAPECQAAALAALLAAGRAPATPVAVVESGTTTAQSTHVTTLADAVRRAVMGAVEGSALVIVGPTVSLRESLSWFESKPLYGWRVLVPRTREQSGATIARLAAYGARPTLVPTISVEPPRSPQHMDRAIRGLVTGRYSWLGFTSVNAVRAVREKVEELGLDARVFAGVHIAAVGGVTAEALRQWGIVPDLVPEGEQSAAGMLADWPDPDDDESAINRVFLPRADIANDALVAGLTAAGWEVDDVTAYRTVRAAPPPPEIRDAIKGGSFDAVLFTSSSTVRNLVGIAGKPHAATIVACIGPQTAKTALEHGLRVDVMAVEPSADLLADALAEHGAGLQAAALEAGMPVRRPSQRRHGARRRAR